MHFFEFISSLFFIKCLLVGSTFILFTGIKYVLSIGLYADWFPSTFEKFGWLFMHGYFFDFFMVYFHTPSLIRMPKTFKLNAKPKGKSATKIAPKKASKPIYNNKGDISKDIMKELDNLYVAYF